jgi:hypothetical protein
MQTKLDNELIEKIKVLVNQKTILTEEYNQLHHLQEQLGFQLETLPKSSIIEKRFVLNNNFSE